MSLCFDATAFFVSLIMLFTYYLRRNIFMKSGFYYSLYLVLLILFSVTEIVIDLDNDGLIALSPTFWFVIKVISMFITYFLTYIVLRYFLAVLTNHRIGKAFTIVVVVYVAIMSVLLVTTPFTGWVLSVEDGEVVRGTLYMLPYYVGLFTFSIVLIAAFLFREKLSRLHIKYGV